MSIIKNIDLTRVCSSFPEIATTNIGCDNCGENEVIIRDNIIGSIDKFFNSGTQIVTIEGEPGIGKTYLLSQFAKKYSTKTISLFIRATTKIGYDIDILKLDLINQLYSFLEQTYDVDLNDKELNDFLIKSCIMKLTRFTQKNNLYYFVIDGMDEIPKESYYIKQQLLDLLPVGYPNFRFLFTGKSDELPGTILRDCNIKSFPLTTFGYDETKRYLSNIKKLEDSHITEIYKITGGFPGKIAIIKRTLTSVSDMDKFIKYLPDEMPGYFELEWKSCISDNKNQERILALIALDKKEYTIYEISKILNIEVSEVMNLIKPLTFICVNGNDSSSIRFVSESFRIFVSQKLFRYKDDVFNILSDYWIKNQDNDDSLLYLANYLEQSKRFNELLDYLSPNNFKLMLDRTRSLSLVQQKADLGVKTAFNLSKYGELIRLGLQRCILKELNGVEAWKSEVKALIALNDYKSAIALAQATVLKEDSLHLFAIIARRKRENGLTVESEIFEQIKHIYGQLDYSSLGDRALEIASDLIFSCPDLAIELVERANKIEKNDNSLDLAFAKLFLATTAMDDSDVVIPSTAETITSRIKDPNVKNLFTGASLLLGDYSAQELISEVEKIEGAGQQLFLLRQWTSTNRTRNDCFEVVNYALNLTIKTTEYSPNGKILRELAMPLPYIKEINKAQLLVGRFDTLKDTIIEKGPTEEYVRLQLLLAETENQYSFQGTEDRLIELYFFISDISDLITRATCIAWLISTISRVDKQGLLEKEYSLYSTTYKSLQSYLENILECTADHNTVTNGIIDALVETHSQVALHLAKKLNTLDRRDEAFSRVLKSYLKLDNIESISFKFIKEIIDNIVREDTWDLSLYHIFHFINEHIDYYLPIINEIKPLIFLIDKIQDSTLKCISYSYAYNFVAKVHQPEYDELAEKLMVKLNDSWKNINVGWQRVNTGFKITKILAEYSIEKAKEYFNFTEQFRNEIFIDANDSASSYILSLKLAIRAYSGLLNKNVNVKDDMEALKKLISRLPSDGVQAELWAEIAIYCFIYKHSDECKFIVNQHIYPLLQNISDKDSRYYKHLIIKISPALYCSHNLTAFKYISTLPEYLRDECYMNICRFILLKLPTSEPYDQPIEKGSSISFADVLDIIEVVEKFEKDSSIYYVLNIICDNVSRRRNAFTDEQRSDICNKISEISKNRLPSKRYIQHDGYKIVMEACSAKISKSTSSDWIKIREEADKIPNISDKVFVICLIAQAMPTREYDRKKQYFSETKDLIDSIPSVSDKIDRYEFLASEVSEFDKSMSKDCLKFAMESIIKSNNPALFNNQLGIIDLAYGIDPEFAASLASMADNDEARYLTRLKGKKQLDNLKLKKSIVNDEKCDDIDEKDYAETAWKMLGALNANRISTYDYEKMKEYIKIASEMPLTNAYPIWSWIIQNFTYRYNNTKHVTEFVRPLFEASLIGTELIGIMAERTFGILKRSKSTLSGSSDNNLLVRYNEREKALEFIKEWIENNVRTYLKICDPYFGPDELGLLLQMINNSVPSCEVYLLTSLGHQDKNNNLSIDEQYTEYWKSISDQCPPETKIVAVGTKTNISPIHDRWWISDSSGLRLGTSFNSIGIKRTSEISLIDENECRLKEDEIDIYLKQLKKDLNGEKLKYYSFYL